jgi:hypothetical protein
MYKYNVKVLNLKKRRKKYINLHLDIESEKAIRKKKAEMQNEIINQMKEYKYEKLNTKIAVEIVVYTSHKNPPSIERFIKNILDIMHKKELLLNKKNDVFLPFEEDRNIKYLSAKYIFLPGKSSVIIKIIPFNSFISDLHFIDTEIEKDESDEEDFMSIKNRYEELILNKKKYINSISLKAYEVMLDWTILDMQKRLTSNMEISPFITMLIYPKKRTTPGFIKDTYKEWADSFINFPIRIKIPEIPTENNTSQIYKEKIKKQLSSYIEARPIFKTLKAPVVVTVFYSPPVKKKGFYKDVDNIMLEYIMPIFKEIFKPPLSLMNLHIKEVQTKESKKYLNAIPNSLNGSAIGYEIIELPKKYSENEKGFLSIGFKTIDIEERGIITSSDEKIEELLKIRNK